VLDRVPLVVGAPTRKLIYVVVDALAILVRAAVRERDCPATGIHLGQIDKSPNSVAYDDGAIVVGFTDGTVAKINPADPAAPAVLWTREVGNDAESIAIDKGIVWVAGGPTNLR
jgi:hypothetical protein